MSYIPHTEEEIRDMMETIGISSLDELFERIPREISIEEPLNVGKPKSEHEVKDLFARLGQKNRPASEAASFMGGGVYDHAVPSVVDHIAMRSEFYTAYTPYQAEVAQGTLQAIFEFQTMISRLTGLPVANASMYDGATALAEAALMAIKITGRKKVVYPASLNPRYARVLSTYLARDDLSIEELPFDSTGEIDSKGLSHALDEDTAAVIVQNPNYFGILERPKTVGEAAHGAGALLVSCVDPLALALVEAPGEYGADIAVGEGQCLGNYMNFGGPLLGFMACREEFVRNMPGRIVSRTRDVEGKEGYVLVLQTREQHIRREKATSNICTNEGLLALRATVYMALLGENGMRELASLCSKRTHELAERVCALDGFSLRFEGPFFREFVLACPAPADEIARVSAGRGLFPGIPLGRYYDWGENCLLVAVTEKRTEEDLDLFLETMKEFSGKGGGA